MLCHFLYVSTKWAPPANLGVLKLLFLSHFMPYQINAQFCFVLYKMAPVIMWDDRRTLSNAFLTISDHYITSINF